MEMSSSTAPLPCAKGCGFFGTPSNLNMCSGCFKKHIAAMVRAVVESIEKETIVETTTAAVVGDVETASAVTGGADETAAAAQAVVETPSSAADETTTVAQAVVETPSTVAGPADDETAAVAEAVVETPSVVAGGADETAVAEAVIETPSAVAGGADDETVVVEAVVETTTAAAAGAGETAVAEAADDPPLRLTDAEIRKLLRMEREELRRKRALFLENKCKKCLKKLGISARFTCRCGGTYCPKHRFMEDHACSYESEYERAGILSIIRNNPRVVADKLRDRI